MKVSSFSISSHAVSSLEGCTLLELLTLKVSHFIAEIQELGLYLIIQLNRLILLPTNTVCLTLVISQVVVSSPFPRHRGRVEVGEE